MKITKFLLGSLILAIGAVVAVSTHNVLAGVVAMPLAGYGIQAATGISLADSAGLAFSTLADIPRTEQQKTNPGGARKLFLIPTDNFVGEWPTEAQATTGEISAAPTLITGTPAPTFTQAAVSDNSLKIDGGLKGATGYQSWEQMLEVKIAGFTKPQVAAMQKLINTEVVAVVILNDGQRVVLGSSLMGLQFEIVHTSGAKGGDRREWTLKAKQDGYMFNYTPIASTVTLPGVPAA